MKPDVVDSIETLVPVAEDWDGQTKPLSELAIGEAVSEITVDGRIYGVLTILVAFFYGSFFALMAIKQPGLGLAFALLAGLAVVFFGVLSGIFIFALAEVISWMLDVEAHLRNRQ